MDNPKQSGELSQNKSIKTIWGYAESFLVALEIIIIGFVIEVFLKGEGFQSPQMPHNLYYILALIIIQIFCYATFRNNALIKWFSSIPCSVSAILFYAILVLLLGFISQQGDNQSQWLQLLGLNHIKNSCPFLLIQTYLLVSLGMVVLRRGFPFKLKNLGFLMNHLGLWITLVAAGFGSGDLKRVTIELFENKDYKKFGILSDQRLFEMPFSLKLIDFNIDLYNPKIAVADGSKGEILQKHGETLPIIHNGFETTLIDWKIKIKEFLPNAIKTDSGYIKLDKPGSIAVAYVETKNVATGDTATGWISNGSLMFGPRYLDLKGNKLLLLTDPEPKKFESLVAVRDASGVTDTVKIEVNKPYRINGWKLYQISYDTKMGKYSTLSVIEAVKDPWLPYVYTGVFLLLGGAIYLFWLGRGTISEHQ
jgi:hypothetical protein